MRTTLYSRLSRRALLIALAGGTSPSGGAAGETASVSMRFGISESVVSEMNLHDARAAMQVWLRRIGSDVQMRLDHVPRVFDRFDRIAAQLRLGELDAVGCNILEYRKLARWLNKTWVVVPAQKQPLAYMLLGRAASGASRVADLKGKRLTMLASANACLAPAWLGNLLHEAGEEEISPFFAEVTSKAKVSQVILPAYFGQTDACLCTKQGFRTLCELNPQVATQLRPLATSPEVVSMVYAFGEHVGVEALERTLRVLADIPGSAAGRQVLTLFQIERLEARSTDVLRSSLGILASAERRNHGKGGSQ